MSDISLSDIQHVAEVSNLQDFTGEYSELGGGEVNDTFLLDCGGSKAILRVARYADVKNLHREADALEKLTLDQVPKVLLYDQSDEIRGRSWILESYVEGSMVEQLSVNQYGSLGKLLAEVHKVKSLEKSEADIWKNFVEAHNFFGTEEDFINHPDSQLRGLIHRAHSYFDTQTNNEPASLIHFDATPSNILVNGDNVSLIDWEMARYMDPMYDFSSIYYDDIEYNKGKWRPHIKPDEKAALFHGYTEAGGSINEDRINIWMNYSKLGASIFLYWRIYQSGRTDPLKQIVQYQFDFDNLKASLERNLP